MQTTVWRIHVAEPGWEDGEAIREAAALLRNGELVAFPTETVYGLGADATNDDAVGRIFTAKGRPADNPLIVHVADKGQLSAVVAEVSEVARRLIDRFWPGPLTLVLPHRGTVSARVTCGLPTVAVRMPAHPVARALIAAAGVPVAAPSANRSGKPSPTTAAHVLADLAGRIAGVVDGGPTSVGVESTVLDLTTPVPTILRPGGVTQEELAAVVGEVALDPALVREGEVPRSPGIKYTHYAPAGEMTLVAGAPEVAARHIQRLADEAARRGERVGILTTEDGRHRYRGPHVVVACGRRDDLASVAAALYAALRRFDQEGVTRIYAETFPEEGIGAALMNRLRKAAGGRIVSGDLV